MCGHPSVYYLMRGHLPGYPTDSVPALITSAGRPKSQPIYFGEEEDISKQDLERDNCFYLAFIQASQCQANLGS